MTAFLVLLIVWNGAAVIMGIVGAMKRDLRQGLARTAMRQALGAAFLSVAVPLLGLAIALLLSGEAASAVRGMTLFFGAVFWAVGGLVPMTVGVLLAARFSRGR